jgi:hypothetical protein
LIKLNDLDEFASDETAASPSGFRLWIHPQAQRFLLKPRIQQVLPPAPPDRLTWDDCGEYPQSTP